ncbi:MAG: ABC transporter permease subunit [Sedimentisphaerales bacterium]|nr:ABC transporter permease subunit [Sedimentisphaerales bacterium]
MPTLITTLRFWFDPLRWTGPIFDKELRVSSRRRRNYVLRTAYVLVMLLFIWLVWVETVSDRVSSANVIAQMSRAGIELTMAIVWFQFVGLQLVAVSMLSTAIRDELASKTLGVLLTTPISSLQIVIGKLLSKLLQLFALLALSLPVLAIIRVFGGVRWDYIIAALSITLTTLVFDAAVCLFISVTNRKSYQVLAAAVVVLVVLFGLIPLMIVIIWDDLNLPWVTAEIILSYVNPFVVLGMVTDSALYGGGIGFGSSNSFWLTHCGIMLGVTALLLLVTTLRVRKAALRQMAGEPARSLLGRRKGRPTIDSEHADESRIRRLKGKPIVWKELREPLVRVRSLWQKIMLTLILLFMAAFYGYTVYRHWMEEEVFHILFVVIYMIAGMFATMVGAAAAITKERETRSWPILLITPLTDGGIIYGKVVGTIRRYMPIWLFLGVHLMVFSLFGYINPAVLVHMPLIILNGVIYAVLSGLCFSSLCRKTALALVLTLLFSLGWMIFLPMMLGIAGSSDAIELLISANPIMQSGVIMEATSGKYNISSGNYYYDISQGLKYDWFGENLGFVGTTLALVGFTVLNLILSMVFFIIARTNLRNKLFSK